MPKTPCRPHLNAVYRHFGGIHLALLHRFTQPIIGTIMKTTTTNVLHQEPMTMEERDRIIAKAIHEASRLRTQAVNDFLDWAMWAAIFAVITIFEVIETALHEMVLVLKKRCPTRSFMAQTSACE